MTQKKLLVALSFDSPTYPELSIDFKHFKKDVKLTCAGHDNAGRNVMKTTLSVNAQNINKLLELNESEQGSNTVGNILHQGRYLKIFGLNRKIPYHSVNNMDWILALTVNDPKKPVNKEVFPLLNKLPLPSDSDAYYSAWLMEQIKARKANSLMEMTWTHLYDLFNKIDEQNPCEIVLADSQDLIIYQGSYFNTGLYYVRSCPPHNNNPCFTTGSLSFCLDSLDLNHTMIMVSTDFINHKDAQFLNLKQMMVIRSGELIWNKDPQTFVKKEEIIPSAFGSQAEPRGTLSEVNLLQLPCKSIDGQPFALTVSTDCNDNNPRIYSVSHRSIYEYDSPVYSSTHLFRLQPVSDITQMLLQYELSVLADGEPVHCIPSNFIGAFGNAASFIEIKQPYKRLEVVCRSIVVITALAPRRIDLLHLQRSIPLIWMPWDRIMMQAYLVPPELPESQLRELSNYALTFVKRNNHDLYELLNDINRTIFEDYTYMSGSTTLATTPYEVYASHKGVCQDFANLFICLARLLNIPARYRTGYIYTANDYSNQEQGDASHAWLELFLPFVGWYGYDPTNYCLAEKNHIRLACGRTYSDTAPTSGTIYRGGGEEQLSVNVQVIQLDEIDLKDIRFIGKTK